MTGLLNKGLALVNVQEFKEAIELYNKSLEIAPNCAEAWYYKGLALDKLGKYEDSKECFDKAKQLGLNI